MTEWSGWGDFGFVSDLKMRPQNMGAQGLSIAYGEKSALADLISQIHQAGDSFDLDGIYQDTSLYDPENIVVYEAIGHVCNAIRGFCGFINTESASGLMNAEVSLYSYINYLNVKGRDAQKAIEYENQFEETVRAKKMSFFSWLPSFDKVFQMLGTETDKIVEAGLVAMNDYAFLKGNRIYYETAYNIAKSIYYTECSPNITKTIYGRRAKEDISSTPKRITLKEALELSGGDMKKVEELVKQSKERCEKHLADAKQLVLSQLENEDFSVGENRPSWMGDHTVTAKSYLIAQGDGRNEMWVGTLDGSQTKCRYYVRAEECTIGCEGGGFLLDENTPSSLYQNICNIIGKGKHPIDGGPKYTVMENPDGNFIQSEIDHRCAGADNHWTTGKWGELPVPVVAIVDITKYAKFK